MLDEHGVCSACQVAEQFAQLPPTFWDERRKRFERVLEETGAGKRNDNYDCIIPVSGGKDSYYQAHVIAAQYGLKPLLVTYHGNNYLPEGDYNRDRMRHVFDADHMVFGPSVEVLKRLNRLCFRKMGDMNWHAHCGIMTYPIQVAVKFDIPLIIWGETAWDISGMFDPDDYVEFSARVRHEHALRGFEWSDMLDDPEEPLREKDLLWARYPSDADILKTGVRGIYIGNFFPGTRTSTPAWCRNATVGRWPTSPSSAPTGRCPTWTTATRTACTTCSSSSSSATAAPPTMPPRTSAPAT